MPVATSTAQSGLAPVVTALASLRRRRGPESTRGILPRLFAPAADPPPGSAWFPASALVSGERLDELLDAAKQRWGAAPPAAAALAWRSYAYWVTLLTVLSWGTARRVPLLRPDDLLIRVGVTHSVPFLTVGLRSPHLAVLPDDPLAGEPDVTIATSEERLLAHLRGALRDGHLDPLLAQLQTRARLGTRTLLGSLASAVSYAVARGLDAPPEAQRDIAERLLVALDVADLVVLQLGPDELVVQRRTCCLAFTLPEPKLCSGCCIRSAIDSTATNGAVTISGAG